MDRLYLIPSIITLVLVAIHISPSFGQVADTTIGGIIVPKFISTQAHYCLNGTCGTGGTPKLPTNYTHSVFTYPVLLIKLSQTCEILDKYNMTGCPPIKELMKYDTSNQYASGKFVNHNGIYFRDPPQMKNNWLAYSYSNHKIVCVECWFDFTATTKSQQIIIQPNTFTYVNKTESESKNVYVDYTNRYMQGCDTATISNIPNLLNDTINFMMHNCVKTSTNYNETQKHPIPTHNINYHSPFSTTNHDAYLKTILNGHTYDFGNKTSGGRGPSNCITHKCNFIDPYAKIGW